MKTDVAAPHGAPGEDGDGDPARDLLHPLRDVGPPRPHPRPDVHRRGLCLPARRRHREHRGRTGARLG